MDAPLLLGLDVAVATVRQVSVIGLLIFLLVAAGILWFGRKKPDGRTILQRLGPNLIVPGDGVADGCRRGGRAHAEGAGAAPAPGGPAVIRVGSSYYLQDGSVCYRLLMPGEEGDD